MFQPLSFPASAASIFATPPLYQTVGKDSESVAAADFNGDGALDLVVADECENSNCSVGEVSVFINNGNGTYKPAVSYPSGGVDAWSVATGDVNGDGFVDIIVANYYADTTYTTSSVSVLLGNGDGTFRSPVSYLTAGVEQPDVVVADLNGDGKLDIAVANQCQTSNCSNGSVSVLINNGSGTFQPAVGYASGGQYAYSLAVGSLNGSADLIAVNRCVNSGCANPSVGVLLNNGNGTFQSPSSISVGGYIGLSGVVGDFNGDGKADVAVLAECNSSSCSSGSLSILLGNGDGTFQPPLSSAISSNTSVGESLGAADFNGDGKLDLVAIDGGGQTLQIFLGNGDGTFQAASTFAPFPASLAVLTADFNGDGKMDIAALSGCYGTNCATGAVALLFGNGNGTFQAPPSYSTNGSNPLATAIADLNGDGKPDVIVANQCAASSNCNSGSVSVLLGNGDGTVQAATTYPVGQYPWGIAVKDVNGDNIPDLIVADECGSGCPTGSVSVLLGNGDGTFQPANSFPSGGAYTLSVAVGDFNGDGKIDLVLANECAASNTCGTSGSVSILLGNGDGTFQPAQSVATGGPDGLSVAVGDFNGDGKLDLAVAVFNASNNLTGAMSILLGNGDGTFQPAVVYPSAGLESFSIAVADFNGDGKLDVATGDVCVTSGCGSNSVVSIFLGNGDGTFRAATGYNISYALRGFQSLIVSDFNGDGSQDLAAATYNGGVNLLLGNGDGTFQSATSYNSSYNSYGLAAGDLNLDGKPDLTVVGDAGLVNVLLNTAAGFRYTTTTTITSSANPAGSGQSVTFTATVTPAFSGSPTGTVTFYDGTNSIGTSALSGEQAMFSTSSLAQGAHSITAAYPGDTNFLPSTSAGLTETITVPSGSSTTTLTSSLNPSVYGQSTTLTASVTPSGSGTPTGSVTFSDGSNPLGTSPISGGQAMLSISELSAGTHSITATYSGDSNFSGSNSGVLSQVVTQATTSATITSSLNPAYLTQPITFTATVTGQFGGLATGSVTFKSGSKTLGNASLNSTGQAFMTTSLNGTGSRPITAVYAGDPNDTGCTSPVLTEIVNKFPTITAVTSSPNPSLVGQAVTFTATVSSIYGSIPNGDQVTFKTGGTVFATVALSGGTASYSYSSLPSGTHTVTASYLGDASFGTSSANVSQTVTKNATATTVTSSVNPSMYGQAVTFTATVTDSIGGTPTGTVTFKSGNTTLGTSSLSGSTASLTTSSLAAGSTSIKAIYSGDTTYLGSTSLSLNQMIDRATTTTAIASSQNPSVSGQSVTFTATVTSGAGTPSGTVTFKAGTLVIGTGTLNSSGVATASTSTLPVGSDRVAAAYEASGNFASSSTSLIQTVTQ